VGRFTSLVSQRFVKSLASQFALLTIVSVGSATKAEKGSNADYEHLEALKMALLRLPKIHLYVLDAFVLHLKTFVFVPISLAYILIMESGSSRLLT
jgi:hypothetical protein